MTTRRGLLGLMLGAPVAASSAANGIVSGVAVGECASLGMRPPTSLQKLLGKFRQDHEAKTNARSQQVRYMPPHISEKKSWSPAFKVHVYQDEMVNRSNPWHMSDEELQAFLIKRGYDLASPPQ